MAGWTCTVLDRGGDHAHAGCAGGVAGKPGPRQARNFVARTVFVGLLEGRTRPWAISSRGQVPQSRRHHPHGRALAKCAVRSAQGHVECEPGTPSTRGTAAPTDFTNEREDWDVFAFIWAPVCLSVACASACALVGWLICNSAANIASTTCCNSSLAA